VLRPPEPARQAPCRSFPREAYRARASRQGRHRFGLETRRLCIAAAVCHVAPESDGFISVSPNGYGRETGAAERRTSSQTCLAN